MRCSCRRCSCAPSLRRRARRALRGARSGRPRADLAAEPLLRRRQRRTSASPSPSTATGFTPFSEVDVYIDDILQIQPPRSLRDGTIVGQVLAPFQEEGTGPFTLRLSEVEQADEHVITRDDDGHAARRSSSRRRGRRRAQRVRFKGRGFTDRRRARVRALRVRGQGRASRSGSACRRARAGRSTFKRTQFPFKKSPRRGNWTIQFDQHPRYDPKAAVRVPMTIRVADERPKQESARAR